MSRLMQALRAMNTATGKPQRLGLSMIVRYTPEAATGESLAIGVLLRTDDGRYHARWLSDFQRLRCAFGEEPTVHLPLLLAAARRQAEQGAAITVPHLSCTTPTPVYGDDIQSTLDGLFLRFVPLGRPHADVLRKQPTLSVQNNRLRLRVFELLRRRHNDIADNIIAGNPELRFPDASVPTVLHVPLQGSNGCRGRFGTIVSAQNGKPKSIEMNIYPAAAELAAAAHLHGIKARGVFILRPSEASMDPKQYELADARLYDLVRILEQQGNTVFPEVSEDLLATAVRDWSTTPISKLAPPARSGRALH